MDSSSASASSSDRPPARRWARRVAIASTIAVTVVAGFLLWVWLTCFAAPPALTSRPAILDARQQTTPDGRSHLDGSWFLAREGCSLLSIEGEPFTLGYSNAALTEAFLVQQERELMATVRRFLPSDAALYGTALLVLVHNRNLPDYVPLEYRHEIHGLSHSRGEDPFPGFGPRYHRILNYHAAHDISHWVFDQPALGCTSFAVHGAHTVDGHLIVGRNFDWESGEHFDRNKVIACYRPAAGHAFLSVSWPGMAGVVTGMNDQQLFCSINGAHTEHMGLGVGCPVALVARQVLQYAANLEEAIAIVEAAPVFVADGFLLADGKTGAAVVVEKTPATCAVRRMHAGRIVQANHFESTALAGDRGNAAYMRDGTSLARRERLAELLTRYSGRIDPGRAVAILRDRRGPAGVPRAKGHRGTINPMIATHAVVADLTAGILWVSRGPHQLGAFDPYSIRGFGPGPSTPVAATIPADPVIEDGGYERLKRFRERMAAVREHLPAAEDAAAWADARIEAGTEAAARAGLAAAQELNPGDPELLYLLGRLAERDGAADRARGRYAAALAAAPPFGPTRDALRADLHRLARTRR